MKQFDAATIASGLTKNTREFMLSPLYSASHIGIDAAWFHDTRWWAGRELKRLRLVERQILETGYVASIPNEMGLAVRAHLLGDTNNVG